MEKSFKDYYQFPLHIDKVIPFKAWCASELRAMAYDVTDWSLDEYAYQELVDIINGNMLVTDSETWGKPAKYTSSDCDIYADDSDKPIIRVRGWGRLTGYGLVGYRLSTDEAIKIQNEFVNYILEQLNKR